MKTIRKLGDGTFAVTDEITLTSEFFDTLAQAQWYLRTGQSLSAADAARSMKMADKFLEGLTQVKTGAKVMFTAQQNQCFTGINLMRLRGDITIAPDGQGKLKVTINKTDEELAALGLTRSVEEAGLTSLYLTLSSVPDADSSAIALFME